MVSMLALMAALMMTSPLFVKPNRPATPPLVYAEDFDACYWTGQVMCTAAGCYCGPRSVLIDREEYRPAADAITLTAPEPFGAYSCELRDGSPAVQAAPEVGPSYQPGDMQLSPNWRDEMGFGQ